MSKEENRSEETKIMARDYFDRRMPLITTDKWRWLREVKVGDVLKVNGSLRVVRGVSHGPFPDSRSTFSFAIKRCSWTRRGYTVYTSSDLITLGALRMNKRMPLRTKLDRVLSEDISKSLKKPQLSCCDVEGMY